MIYKCHFLQKFLVTGIFHMQAFANNFNRLCFDFKCLLLFLGAKNKFSVECLVTAWLFATLTLTSISSRSKSAPIIICISLGTTNAVGHQSNPHSSSHFVLNFFNISLRVENFESIGYSNPLLPLMLNWEEYSKSITISCGREQRRHDQNILFLPLLLACASFKLSRTNSWSMHVCIFLAICNVLNNSTCRARGHPPKDRALKVS